MKVLVTGGAGYIGSHTCKALSQAGYEPVVVDNLSNGYEEFVKWGPLHKVDILDREALLKVFREVKPEFVIHLAGFIEVSESVAKPLSFYENNVMGSIRLLQCMQEAGCRNIVFSSTCAVYGMPEFLPLTESHPTNPVSPYGQSKWMVEEVIRDQAKTGALNYANLRYFNVSGADPEGELYENHNPETHLIPLLLQAANGTRKQFNIYGQDYETDDGTCIRDFIHVSDLAQAHIKAAEYLLNGGEPGEFNIGTGRGYSVREVVELVKEVTGKDFPVEEKERRPGDSSVLVAGPERANNELGWRPKYTDLKEHIQHAWRHL